MCVAHDYGLYIRKFKRNHFPFLQWAQKVTDTRTHNLNRQIETTFSLRLESNKTVRTKICEFKKVDSEHFHDFWLFPHSNLKVFTRFSIRT